MLLRAGNRGESTEMKITMEEVETNINSLVPTEVTADCEGPLARGEWANVRSDFGVGSLARGKKT